jgi:limonene-1,2-epoxide hydrolase
VETDVTANEAQGRTPAQVVLEFYAAIRDRRIDDILALVDPQVVCHPLVRPGLSVYRGYDGMIRLSEDMHAAHGEYDFTADRITEDGATVTVHARIVPGTGQDVLPVTTEYTLQDGLILTIESEQDSS